MNDWMLKDIRAAKRRNRALCVDCDQVPTVHYGVGSRCAEHAKVWDAHAQAERLRLFEANRAALVEHQAAGCPDDGMTCPECCEHADELDHGICIDCGKDLNG